MKRGLWMLFLVLLVSSGGVFWRMQRPNPKGTILLVAAPAHQWEGLSQGQQSGVMALFQDVLEQDARLSVATSLSSKLVAGFQHEVWTLSARREGSDLELSIRRRDARGNTSQLLAHGPPQKTFQRLLTQVNLPSPALNRLIPAEPLAFWDLAELMGPFIFPELKAKQAQAQALAQRIPECAAAHYRVAYFSLRLLIVEANTVDGALALCEGSFQRALELLPGYPRAMYQLVRFKTDVGSFQESLTLGLEFRRRYPRSPLAHGCLVYSARNAGLLEGALRALRERERLTGGFDADPGLAENTYLYLGDLDAFEQSLNSGNQVVFSPVRHFYRGYLALLRGKRLEALRFFRETQQQPGVVNQFELLAHVYELALSDRRGEALIHLRQLRAGRTSLRIPDGEFTFKLAEALAFLGQQSEAMECANRAFAQGFGCTRWYEQSPLLAPIRELPRWGALRQHLIERQAYLEQSFPASRF